MITYITLKGNLKSVPIDYIELGSLDFEVDGKKYEVDIAGSVDMYKDEDGSYNYRCVGDTVNLKNIFDTPENIGSALMEAEDISWSGHIEDDADCDEDASINSYDIDVSISDFKRNIKGECK